MCGIVGFTGAAQAAPILLDGLAKLEYRGYDSAGIAVQNAAGGGVAVLATIHARDEAELGRKPLFRALCRTGAFSRLVVLSVDADGRHSRVGAMEGGGGPCC